jgi:SAM-dependent methyltransferase
MNAKYNQRTVAAYEGYAREYAHAVSRQPSASGADALRRLAAATPAGSQILDIGSGPGWDADFLESLGARLHRTDVTAAFRAFQAERGQQVEAFDLLADEIAGSWHGILLLCVIQHFERTDADRVLRKLGDALVAGGVLLLSHPLGDNETWEGDASDYRVVRWTSGTLDPHLARAGLDVEWEAFEDSDEGPWRTLLARRRA